MSKSNQKVVHNQLEKLESVYKLNDREKKGLEDNTSENQSSLSKNLLKEVHPFMEKNEISQMEIGNKNEDQNKKEKVKKNISTIEDSIKGTSILLNSVRVMFSQILEKFEKTKVTPPQTFIFIFVIILLSILVLTNLYQDKSRIQLESLNVRINEVKDFQQESLLAVATLISMQTDKIKEEVVKIMSFVQSRNKFCDVAACFKTNEKYTDFFKRKYLNSQ